MQQGMKISKNKGRDREIVLTLMTHGKNATGGTWTLGHRTTLILFDDGHLSQSKKVFSCGM